MQIALITLLHNNTVKDTLWSYWHTFIVSIIMLAVFNMDRDSEKARQQQGCNNSILVFILVSYWMLVCILFCHRR